MGIRAIFSAAALLVGCAATTRPPAAPDPFSGIEASAGGRVGVFALDTGTGRTLARRSDERFAMCSTFKWGLAAAVLERVDRAELALGQPVRYGERDLLEYAPVTRTHVARGSMSIDELAGATLTVSDNTAANLLLPLVGGPAGLTAFFRRLGDGVTRLDRTEPMLNENRAGDPRDTTSPRAMVGALHATLRTGKLALASRERLLAWMRASPTGRDRLRAGLPPNWTAGDKTGTCNRGAVNDVAIAWPPGRPPILIAAYLSDSTRSLAELNAAQAEIGRIVAAELR
ncbi:MAG: class A beta-lactamase [Myxococcales bacterium]|nr:class A beta-lactamase [Myxococcales bacterium]